MLLTSDAVRLAKKATKALPEVLLPFQPEHVQVAPWGESLDFDETRRLMAIGQHQVALEGGLLRSHRSEAHPDLKCDAALLRDDPHWSDLLHEREEPIVELSDLRVASRKEVVQGKRPAGVPLVS
jgi:hypothetical protein